MLAPISIAFAMAICAAAPLPVPAALRKHCANLSACFRTRFPKKACHSSIASGFEVRSVMAVWTRRRNLRRTVCCSCLTATSRRPPSARKNTRAFRASRPAPKPKRKPAGNTLQRLRGYTCTGRACFTTLWHWRRSFVGLLCLLESAASYDRCIRAHDLLWS